MYPNVNNNFYHDDHDDYGGQNQPFQQRVQYYSNDSLFNLAKSDRRQWNKSNKDFNMDYPDPEKMAEIQKRHEEYLFNLHMNNQVVKLMSKKDEKVEKLEKLERGFNCYVNGTHQTSQKYIPRYTTSTKSSGYSSSVSSTDRKPNMIRPRVTPRSNMFSNNLKDIELLMGQNSQRCQSAPTRKKWSNDSFTIKTNDGYEIKINAPGATRPKFTQSDNTEQNKDDNNKKKDKTKRKSGSKCGGGKATELNYSEDFESDDDSEVEEVIEENKELIESVQFSEESDSEAEQDQASSNRKLQVRLSSNDIKMLRQSINQLNLAAIKKDQTEFQSKFESTNEESEIEDETESSNKDHDESKRVESEAEEVEEDIEAAVETEPPSSSADKKDSNICDLLISKVAHLGESELKNLVAFLDKIDPRSHKAKKNKNKNK